MKIRLLNNSIRFRLKRSEVAHFRDSGEIKATTEFAAGKSLCFSLIKTESNAFDVICETNLIEIKVPAELCNGWADSELVSIEHLSDAGAGNQLKILIEKDFTCLHGSENENADSYPNPNMA